MATKPTAAVATATTASDPALESFAVSQGIAGKGRRSGQTYAVVTLWANGRPTLSKIYADNKEHLLSILDRMMESVEAWTEPTATPPAVVRAEAIADHTTKMDAMMAEMARLQAENAALAGKSAPAAAPAASAAPASAAQSRLSRISRRK